MIKQIIIISLKLLLHLVTYITVLVTHG